MTPDVAGRLDMALGLAAQGFSIGECYGVTASGRCRCPRTGCEAPGKHGGKGWLEQATTDPEVIRSRFLRGDPNYMAIPAAKSRLVIVDEDVPGSLEALGPLPDTLIVQTSEKTGGARGRHLYGRLPNGVDEAELRYLWAGGEVRSGGNGGVVGPLSRHRSGTTYDPANGSAAEVLPEAWVRALIASGSKRTNDRDSARDPSDPGWFVDEPGRHAWLASQAGKLQWAGFDGPALRDVLRYLNQVRCRPPKPEVEVDEIAAWAATRQGDLGPDHKPSRPSGSTRPAPRNVGASLPPSDVDDWVIEGVLRPRAILVVASVEGLGKSYVRKEMAARLTTCGGSLFGYYPVFGSGSVLEIDEENGETEEFRREEQVFSALGVRREDAADYWSVSYAGLDLGDEDAHRYLREQVAGHRPRVLLLDTGTSMVREEWGPELKGAMRFLRSLTVEYACAIVIFVHLVKPARGRDGSARPHGSVITDVMGQWTRLVDAVAVLTDLGDGRAKWSMFKRVPKSELVIAQAEGLWQVVQVRAEHPLTTDAKVLRAISSGGTGPAEIAIALGFSKRTVSAAICRLRRHGLILPGYPYELTDSGRASLE